MSARALHLVKSPVRIPVLLHRVHLADRRQVGTMNMVVDSICRLASMTKRREDVVG